VWANEFKMNVLYYIDFNIHIVQYDFMRGCFFSLSNRSPYIISFFSLLYHEISSHDSISVLLFQMEQLYIEVLYTIKYKVGLSSNQTSQYQEELYSYAQRAFKVSNDVHRRYLSIASEEKVS